MKKNGMISIFSLLGLLVATASAADITGQWRAEFDTQIGVQKYLFTFKTDGDKLTGTAAVEVGDQKRQAEFIEGKIADDRVSFAEMLNIQGNDIRIQYSGKIGPNEIDFKREVGDLATENFKATRVGAAAASGSRHPPLKDAFKNDFYVGAAINRTIANGAAVRPDNVNRQSEQVEKDIALVKEQFNQISPENDLKWALIHPREGAAGYHFGPADAYVDFGLSNHMFIVGHTLVWHGQTPNWVFAGTNPPPASTHAAGTNSAGGRRSGGGFGYNGPRASREELLQRMHDHIATVVGRYKGKVKVWDVVNEAVADNGTNILRNSLWLQIIGPDFIAKAFEFAHAADPEAILRYNDYGLENPGKRHKLIALIKSLQEQHVPITAIGSQTHVSVSSPSFETEDQALTELETLGLPIHITELDVNGAQGGQRGTGADVANNAATTQGGLVDDANERLATEYATLFRAFLKHRNSVKVVTMWGVNDGVSWRAAGRPLLFDANDQAKPAFEAVIAEAKKGQAAK